METITYVLIGLLVLLTFSCVKGMGKKGEDKGCCAPMNKVNNTRSDPHLSHNHSHEKVLAQIKLLEKQNENCQKK